MSHVSDPDSAIFSRGFLMVSSKGEPPGAPGAVLPAGDSACLSLCVGGDSESCSESERVRLPK